MNYKPKFHSFPKANAKIGHSNRFSNSHFEIIVRKNIDFFRRLLCTHLAHIGKSVHRTILSGVLTFKANFIMQNIHNGY